MTPIFAGVAVELGIIIGQLWPGPLLRAFSDADVTVGTQVLIDGACLSVCVWFVCPMCAGRDSRCHVATDIYLKYANTSGKQQSYFHIRVAFAAILSMCKVCSLCLV